MKNIITIVLILVLPVLAYILLDNNKNSNVIEVAQAGNKPKVLIFSSAMCSECIKMKKVINEVEPQYADKIEFIKYNAQDNSQEVASLMKKYQVTLVPTLIFINTDGKVIKKQVGSESKDTFVTDLKRLD